MVRGRFSIDLLDRAAKRDAGEFNIPAEGSSIRVVLLRRRFLVPDPTGKFVQITPDEPSNGVLLGLQPSLAETRPMGYAPGGAAPVAP